MTSCFTIAGIEQMSGNFRIGLSYHNHPKASLIMNNNQTTQYPAHEALKKQPNANLFSRVIDEATITDHVNDVPTLLAEFTHLQARLKQADLLVECLTKVYDFLNDDRIGTVSYMEGSEFYRDCGSAAALIQQSLANYQANKEQTYINNEGIR